MRSTASFLDSVQDGPMAGPRSAPGMPQGSAYTQTTPNAARGLTLGVPADAEMYRIRTRPELYPDWLTDKVHEHRSNLLDRIPLDLIDWDCHDCHRAVITPPGQGVKCPNCGNAPVHDMTTGARLA